MLPIDHIERAAHRLNPCLDMEADIVVVEATAGVASAADWNQPSVTIGTGVGVSPEGIVSLVPNGNAVLFSQTADATVHNHIFQTLGGSYAIDWFPDPGIFNSQTQIVLDSLELWMGTQLIGANPSFSGTVRFQLQAFDQSWNRFGIGTAIDVTSSELHGNAPFTLDLSGQQIRISPGFILTRTGPGRNNAGNLRTSSYQIEGTNTVFTARGLSVLITIVSGVNPTQLWIGCADNAAVANLDPTTFWRVAVGSPVGGGQSGDRSHGPYSPLTNSGYSPLDLAHDSDPKMWTGAVPNFGAMSVTNGWIGVSRPVAGNGLGTRANDAQLWAVPYHALSIQTYPVSGTVTVPFDLTETPADAVECKFNDFQAGSELITYNLHASSDNFVSSDVAIGNVQDGDVVDADGVHRIVNTVDTVVIPAGSAGPTPDDWFAADSLALTNGTAVAAWTNNADNTRNGSQGTGADQPIFTTGVQNGLPALAWDGKVDNIVFTTHNKPLATFFFAVRWDATSFSQFGRLYSDPAYDIHLVESPGAGTATLALTSKRSTTNGAWASATSVITRGGAMVILELAYDSTSTSNVPAMKVNGNAVTVNTSTAPVGTQTSGAGAAQLGNSVTSANFGFDGMFGEMSAFASVLSTSDAGVERQRYSTRWGISVTGGVTGGASFLERYYKITATLASATGATHYASPSIQALTLQSRQTFSTFRYIGDMQSTLSIDPVTGQSEIAELALPMYRLTRDARDLATQLATQYAPENVEARIYAVDRVSKVRWYKDSFRLEQRDPSDDQEGFTFLSVNDRLTATVPINKEQGTPAPSPGIGSYVVAGASVTGLGPCTVTVTVIGAPFIANTMKPTSAVSGSGQWRVVWNSGILGGQSFFILTSPANTSNTFSFITPTTSDVPSNGDAFEIHSDIFSRDDVPYTATDYADVYRDVRDNQAQVPTRYRGTLPVATNRLTTARLVGKNNGTKASEVLAALALHCGGVVYPDRGTINFAEIFSDVIPSVTWDERHYVSLETPTGMDRRMPVVQAGYGFDFSADTSGGQFANQAQFVDTNAFLGYGLANLYDIQVLPDLLCQWNDADEAQNLAAQMLSAFSTGVRLWKVKTVLAYPWLTIGDRVGIITQQYTDRRVMIDSTGNDTGSPVAGRTQAVGAIVGKDLWGQEFMVMIPGLTAVTSFAAVGGLGGPFDAIAIPTDFRLSVNVQGDPGAPVAWVTAKWTPPDTPFFHHMEYSVQAKRTVDSAFGAVTTVVGTASGSDRIMASAGTDVQVTPITVSTTGKRFSADTPFTVTVPAYTQAAPTITGVGGANNNTYTVTWDFSSRYVRWWSKLFTSVTDPGTAMTVYNVGTEMPRIDNFTLTSGPPAVVLGQTVDATNNVELTTFVAYDANNFPSGFINLRTLRAVPAAPSAPTSASNVSFTSSSVTNQVVLPATLTNFDLIRTYKNGVVLAPDTSRTAPASGTQTLTHSGLGPSETDSWQYSGVSSTGGESSKTTAFSTTTAANTVPTPSIGDVSYDVPSHSFAITIAPGAGTPVGVLWHLKAGTANPPTVENAPSQTTSTSMSFRFTQGSDAATVFFLVWGTKSGWTQSANSAIDSATCPASGSGL